jgi:tetratricopeptide (TPR) repeat protein
MSPLQERIAQFRKMANDDPDNELGHYRLGQLLLEDKQYNEAVKSFRRTLELSPQFSKVYQLLAQALLGAGQRDEAVAALRQGFETADERGDRMPRDEMARMLTELGEPAPTPKVALGTSALAGGAAGGTGFRCQRPGCFFGARARQLPAPPMKDEVGQRIYETVCADCWTSWLRDYSIKVINELRLDLSTERGQEEYDRYMREYLGLE